MSDLTIDKKTLAVVSGKDFLASASDLYLASADGSSWTNGTTTAFARFCSGDLAAASAFRNGTTGYDGRIYLTGEENGPEGRAFAHVLTGSDAGKVYELASLGNLSFENVVANPLAAAVHKEGAPAQPSGSEQPEGVWERFSDAGDTWFVHSRTGESVWELPPGASLAAGPGTAV